MAAALALVAVLAVAASPAAALDGPIEWQLTGGWYTESSDFVAGAGARLGFGPITAIPNAEYVFVDGGGLYTLNLDGTMNVLPLGVATGYLGAGLAMVIADPDGGDSTTDTGFNVIAGAGLNAIKFKPFGQFKWIVKDDKDLQAIVFGVRF
jgi:hypothetical protein